MFKLNIVTNINVNIVKLYSDLVVKCIPTNKKYQMFNPKC